MNDVTQTEFPPVDIARLEAPEIEKLIPHRYPFLLLDRVFDVRFNHSAVGLKNVTFNEPFFTGHFPGRPVMPGVLIVEAMAQASAITVVTTLGEEARDPIVYFMSIESAKFRKPVVPGDQLFLHVVKDRQRGPVWRFAAQAKVDGVVVAEALITAMVANRDKVK